MNGSARWITVAAVLAAGLPLGGCRGGQRRDLDRELAIASDAAFPPFHFLDEAGEPTGHDIELARAVARKMGQTPRVVVVRPYADLLNGLLEGRYNMVAATTGITPERQRTFLFSDPYFDTCQAVAVRRGPGEPMRLADLTGRRVGYAGDGTSARAARGIVGAEPVRLDKGQAGIPSLLAGDIDALVVDEFDAVAAAREQPGALAVLPEPAALEQYAFVLHPSRPDLQQKINSTLAELRRDGTLERLARQFGLNRGAAWPVRLEHPRGAARLAASRRHRY